MYLGDTSRDTRRDVKECIQEKIFKFHHVSISGAKLPKAKMINRVLLLVFPRSDAQTLGTRLTACFHLPSGNRGLWVWGFQTIQIPLAGRHWYFRYFRAACTHGSGIKIQDNKWPPSQIPKPTNAIDWFSEVSFKILFPFFPAFLWRWFAMTDTCFGWLNVLLIFFRDYCLRRGFCWTWSKTACSKFQKGRCTVAYM